MLPAAHRLHLRAVVDAAIDDGGAQLHGGARGRGHVGDLFGGYNGGGGEEAKIQEEVEPKKVFEMVEMNGNYT